MIYSNLIYGHIMALKRTQDCSNRLSHLRETDVSSWSAGRKIIFQVISPEPKVAATIHLHFTCGHIAAFKRAYSCLNRFSHLREKVVSLMEVGLKITFPVISPEPEAAVMIHLHLIRDHSSVFKRAQDYPNRLSHLREKDVSLMEVGLKSHFWLYHRNRKSPPKSVYTCSMPL